MATVLYTALADLEVRNQSASWPCPAGNVLPLDPAKPSTQLLLTENKITPAPDDAVDNTTPGLMVRGVPGMHVAVAN